MGFFPNTIYNTDGQFIKWERTVKNSGPNSTTDVYLEITAIDPVFGYISHTVSKGSYNPLTKKWTIGSMAHNEEVRITIYFVTQSAAFEDVFLTAEVYGAGTDPITVNNEVTDSMMYVNLNDDIRDFVVSDRTAYVSTVRNLNNEVGTPVHGDISRCWNVNTSDFDWTDVINLPDETKAPVYMFSGYYNSQSLNSTIYNANYSKFNALSVNDESRVFNIDNFNTLYIAGKSIVEVNELDTSPTITLGNGGADISIKNILGTCNIILNETNTIGVYNINIDKITSTSQVRVYTNGSFSKGSGVLSINFNIKKMDGKLLVGNPISGSTNLNGVDFKININECIDGILELKSITRNADTNINITGNFYDDGNSAYGQNAKIQFTGTWDGSGGSKPIIKDSTIVCKGFGSPTPLYAKAISAGTGTTAFSCLNTVIRNKSGELPLAVDSNLVSGTNLVNLYTSMAPSLFASFNNINIVQI